MRTRPLVELPVALAVGAVMPEVWITVMGYASGYIQGWWLQTFPWIAQEPKSWLFPVLWHGQDVLVALVPGMILGAGLGRFTVTWRLRLQLTCVLGFVGFLVLNQWLYGAEVSITLWFFSQYDLYLAIASAPLGILVGRALRERRRAARARAARRVEGAEADGWASADRR